MLLMDQPSPPSASLHPRAAYPCTGVPCVRYVPAIYALFLLRAFDLPASSIFPLVFGCLLQTSSSPRINTSRSTRRASKSLTYLSLQRRLACPPRTVTAGRSSSSVTRLVKVKTTGTQSSGNWVGGCIQALGSLAIARQSIINCRTLRERR